MFFICSPLTPSWACCLISSASASLMKSWYKTTYGRRLNISRLTGRRRSPGWPLAKLSQKSRGFSKCIGCRDITSEANWRFCHSAVWSLSVPTAFQLCLLPPYLLQVQPFKEFPQIYRDYEEEEDIAAQTVSKDESLQVACLVLVQARFPISCLFHSLSCICQYWVA